MLNWTNYTNLDTNIKSVTIIKKKKKNQKLKELMSVVLLLYVQVHMIWTLLVSNTAIIHSTSSLFVLNFLKTVLAYKTQKCINFF